MLGIALRRVYEFDDGNRRTGVWAALMSSGHEWPGKRVTVNLAPWEYERQGRRSTPPSPSDFSSPPTVDADVASCLCYT